ncbi:hypothetical protein [Rickettsia helvetica]|uniref:Ankyrin repeat protein n=1 Tax=Rickettsia helvetica TaxID=35789 RepID=A0ABM9NAQ3_RICHE|nr:hypothetical protein [Rickettsia helvetica]MCZ6883856.1 hypothetical protein [Rickettsia endosymbiont of Ixodes ricinus]MCZ6896626.1 hypothetical protein [Rickettsia endosymbiont of Ixodes ricinus]
MDITELSKVANNGETALSLATKHGFKNICDLLTNKNLANKAEAGKKCEEQQQ